MHMGLALLIGLGDFEVAAVGQFEIVEKSDIVGRVEPASATAAELMMAQWTSPGWYGEEMVAI